MNKHKVKIRGMHCASCEVLIERKFNKINGVEKVKVNHAKGEAEVHSSRNIELGELQQALDGQEYEVCGCETIYTENSNTEEYLKIGAIFVLVLGIYILLKQFDLLPSIGITDNMSYGIIFVMGLIAAASTCMAITGGLLLTVSSKYNEAHPGLSSAQKFKPHLYFNTGRIISYTLLGGAVGALGSFLTFSPKITGILMVVVSAVMILLGLQMLNIFPGLQRFQLKMPKFIAHKAYDNAEEQKPFAPFLFGASSFFFPCGFTQALQLYVLSTGNALTGALVMLVFSLGTLPGLLSVGALTSFLKGTFQKRFIRIVAVVIILIGFLNISSGLTLVGVNTAAITSFGETSAELNYGASNTAGLDPNVELVDGKQIVKMKVVGYEYSPSQFTILQGVPVEWQIDGTRAAGCAQVLIAPSVGVTAYLPKQGIKTITFTPEEIGKILFSCSMGMTTPGAGFNVIANNNAATTNNNDPSTISTPSSTANLAYGQAGVQDAAAGKAQVIKLSVNGGRYLVEPSTVKMGSLVRIQADVSQMPGCSKSLVIPAFNIAKNFNSWDNTLEFTPTKAGTFNLACSMNMYKGTITVLNSDGTTSNYIEPASTRGGSCGGGSGGGCGGCGG